MDFDVFMISLLLEVLAHWFCVFTWNKYSKQIDVFVINFVTWEVFFLSFLTNAMNEIVA